MPPKSSPPQNNGKPSRKRRRKKSKDSPPGSPVDINGGSDVYITKDSDTKSLEINDSHTDTFIEASAIYSQGMNNSGKVTIRKPLLKPTGANSERSQTATQQTNMTQIPSSGPPCPPWAYQIMQNVEEINKKLSTLDSIEKSLNSLNVKVHDLDRKVSTMDTRLTCVEESCTFMSDQYDSHKADINTAKERVDTLKHTCETLEDKVSHLSKEKSQLEDRLTEIECRSMRENLLFHGIAEKDNENCESIIKDFCKTELDLPRDYVDSMIIDRAHRIGKPTYADVANRSRLQTVSNDARNNDNTRIRPIVVKFHKYGDRERVRETSFVQRDRLKTKSYKRTVAAFSSKPKTNSLPNNATRKGKGTQR